MSSALVVCHFDEDLTWCREPVWRDCAIYVYDRGPRQQRFFIPNATVIPDRNKGMNLGVYWRHIVEYYDVLEDIVYFLQGDPFEQCPDLLERVAANQAGQYVELRNPEWNPTCDAEGRTHHPGLPVAEMYAATFGRPWPGSIDFNPSTGFGVPRALIHRWPVEFYQRQLAISTTHPLGPWLSERMARHIFHPDSPEAAALAGTLPGSFAVSGE